MRNICNVLYEQIIAAARDVQEKTEIYAPYNILPLDMAGGSQSIMQLEEVFSYELNSIFISCLFLGALLVCQLGCSGYTRLRLLWLHFATLVA